MKILLTGANGYIGKRLLPVLLENGHEVYCLVRDKRRFTRDDYSSAARKKIHVIEGDFTESNSLDGFPTDIDAAYYLVHSMTTTKNDFHALEKKAAKNFVQLIDNSDARQIIYLGGIANDVNLSRHLRSRRDVEDILQASNKPVTILRAAIIIGSGSASFEIIRDLVEKLPIMLAPKWLKTKCQPIGIRNVIEYLSGVLLNARAYHKTFDIGGTDILTYREMLMTYARVRGLRRTIISVPFLSPRLSSLWLYFVTSTSYTLATKLVSSLRNEVICKDDSITTLIDIRRLSYEDTLRLALDRIQNKNVVSSWIDTFNYNIAPKVILNNIVVPEFGCYKDVQVYPLTNTVDNVVAKLWKIGGKEGWYYGNSLWKIRGIMDKAVGGVGLRRGRRSDHELRAGDALDFWRVVLADKTQGRLLLFAEMKLPGEAWLEFRVNTTGTKTELIQTATFRPLGVWGRIYWYCVVPFHSLIFPGMAKNIAKG